MLTPITLLWAALFGLLSLALATGVVRARARENVMFGDGANVALQQRIRVHANFVEYVPIALLLLLLLELNSTSTLVLNSLGAALLVGRVLHAFGLSSSTGRTPGRFLGTILTWTVILVASALALYTRFS